MKYNYITCLIFYLKGLKELSNREVLRITELLILEKSFWGSSIFPCSKQVQLEFSHVCVQPGFEYLKDGDFTTSLGNLFQQLATLPLKKKESFFNFMWNFIYFSFCPLHIFLSLDSPEKSLPPCFLPSFHQLFVHICKRFSEPKPFFSMLNGEAVSPES